MGELPSSTQPANPGFCRAVVRRSRASPSSRRHQRQTIFATGTGRCLSLKPQRRQAGWALQIVRLSPRQRREDGVGQYQRHSAGQAREDYPALAGAQGMGGAAAGDCRVGRKRCRGRRSIHGDGSTYKLFDYMIVLFSWLVWLGNGSGSACITPYVHRSSTYASRTTWFSPAFAHCLPHSLFFSCSDHLLC